MLNHSSAEPHAGKSTNHTISAALKRRAQSVINNKSIDAESRALIRYGLEINDPWLAELVRRAGAGENVGDTLDHSETPATGEDEANEEKLEALAELICGAGVEPETRWAILLVLMAMLENSTHPKALANMAKHLAFTRCGELNVSSMVDAQIAVLEAELLSGNAFTS